MHDSFCSEIRRVLNGGVLAFKFDDDGILIRTAEAGPQIVVTDFLKQRVLYANHYSNLAGHPGGRKLYYRIRRH